MDERTSFAAMLRQTLADRRLSRTERRALAELLDERAPGAAERALLRHEAFAIARDELAGEPRARDVVDWLEELVKVLTQPERERPAEIAEACFAPGDACWRKIVGLAAAARRTLEACVFTITDDRLSAALLDAHARGVAVRILSDDDKAHDLGSDLARLAAAGIATRVDRSLAHMHHKFALFDRATLLTGSYNWTRSAAADNHENLIVTNDPRLVEPFAGTFEALWREMG